MAGGCGPCRTLAKSCPAAPDTAQPYRHGRAPPVDLAELAVVPFDFQPALHVRRGPRLGEEPFLLEVPEQVHDRHTPGPSLSGLLGPLADLLCEAVLATRPV